MSVHTYWNVHKITYHRRATVSGNLSTCSGGRASRLVDREVASNSPLRAADALRSLVKLGGHVEVVDGRRLAVLAIENDQRVDLEVREVEVGVDRVEADEEVDEGLLLLLGDVGEKRRLDLVPGGEGGADGDGESECLGVDIANVDTTLVGEEDAIALTLGGDADVEFGVGRVREEGLDDEVVEGAGDSLDLMMRSECEQL
jgi:hypothetical protein